jgi:glycine dehydrogenase
MKINFQYQEKIWESYNNSNVADRKVMLETIGVDSIETLINATIPQSIHLRKFLNLLRQKNLEVNF